MSLALTLCACTKIEDPVKTRTDPTTSTQAQELPCAVSRILRAKCADCHGRPTQQDAPMSLTTWADAHAASVSDAQIPVHARIAARIHDTGHPMPPHGRPQLTVDELSTLDIWLQAGAPSGKDCEAQAEGGTRGTEPQPDAARPDELVAGKGPAAAGPDAGAPADRPQAQGGMAGSVTGATPAGSAAPPPDAGSGKEPAVGSALDQPVAPSDDECEYVDLLARNDESGSPYKVAANASDEYRCFIFDRKLDVRTQALAFLPVTDNLNVMQHWVLYSLESYASRNVVGSCDYPPGYKIIAGGAAGSDPWYLPADVGVEVGRGLFMLEVHYHNPGKPETMDHSGVRVCLSKQPRPKVATVSWLGVERIMIPAKAVDYAVGNRCRPTNAREPIHLLRYWPHMNRLGTRTALRVEHADGTSDTLHNATFSLQAQKSYAVPYVMQPGDSLLTTCYYNNPNDYTISLGLKVSDEMCNHFVVAYPALALTNDAPSAWNDACLGTP